MLVWLAVSELPVSLKSRSSGLADPDLRNATINRESKLLTSRFHRDVQYIIVRLLSYSCVSYIVFELLKLRSLTLRFRPTCAPFFGERTRKCTNQPALPPFASFLSPKPSNSAAEAAVMARSESGRQTPKKNTKYKLLITMSLQPSRPLESPVCLLVAVSAV